MSVLESIRKRTALLVGIIGLALVIFILQSALETGNSLFGSNERSIGRIAGKYIDYNDFIAKLNTAIQNYEQNGQKVDDQNKQMLVEQVWNEFISERVLKVVYKKAGVSVGEDELYDIVVAHPHSIITGQLTDKQTGKVFPNFAKPDGTLDPAKLQGFIQQMNPDQEKYWKKVEDYVKDTRTSEKYNNLIKKGLYVTIAEGKTEYERQTTTYNVQFVAKRYNSVSDSSIQVNEEDLKNYYNNNSYKFQNFETTRKIDYVTFDAFATNEDIEDIRKQMTDVAVDFKNKKTLSEDSALMQAENENNVVDIGMFKKNMISPMIDSSIFTASKGSVFGPYLENSLVKVTKLLETTTVLDSGKVRHILIAYAGSGASQDVKRTKEQAKKMADSLCALLKTKKADFDKTVEKFSDDGGKKKPDLSNPQVKAQLERFFPGKDTNNWKGKGGNYGWIQESSRDWVESFVKGATENKKGDIFVTESNFGYHIMEVLDVSKGTATKYKLASISRKIQPSDKTLNTFNLKASEFAGKYNTTELFAKGCEEQKLVPRLADNIRESDKQIPGLEAPKELIRWVYAAKKGDVSSSFQFGTRFVVARLTDIKEKGTAPYEQVKEDVTIKAKQEKKAQMFLKELSDYLAVAKTAQDLAAKMKLKVEEAKDLVFNSYSVAGLGKEDAMCGAVSVLKQGVASPALKGMNAVYAVWVVSKKDAPTVKDYKATQLSANITLSTRADYEAFEALKTIANIEDHKAKFDF
ncbi:MAG TPA: SurA N-terminal domain-containing protein [Bacteroidia bacterium]|jgi:peptidyl-prolyl cis-trans isomerase D|nr:SurA N-terminal domain-containing protein [Bacteroidia bacterium]